MTDFNGKAAVICTAAGAVGGFVVNLFGGWNIDIETLLIFMVVDYILGLVCAGIFGKSKKSGNGGLSSSACWKGIAKKAATFAFVIIAHRLDLIIGVDYIRTGTVIAFCTYEALSIIENAGLMGVPLPAALKKAIDILESKQGGNENDGDH